ncbi:DUF4198 domain-containing protein [Roseibacillus ishigakijimensis]|uniref:DUF4198 domain-containing protein n=1 Tax=Roseibacillus ishigakijimensis TaxID=454146 RepID=A0A934RNM5_9BACT|nr:DUF4198 domain-containing protein [Roseibacillus ishigakijimensis]MBK1834143.1 DUF4198 domain-containing protein [Roseibacillus ishigakijimensis]
MKSTIKTVVLGTALLSVSVSSLFAHRAWILPSTSVLSGDSPWVSFDAAISNDLFFPNHHAMGTESIKVISPSGAEVEKQFENDGHIRSSFEIQLEEKGTYLINRDRLGYFASWEEEGEAKRWRGDLEEFKAEGLAEKEGIELTESSSKTVTYVTNGAPDTKALEPTGKGLEIKFTDSHPNDLFTGEEATFTFVLDGKPVEGVEVFVQKGNDRFRDSPNPIEGLTTSEGTFSFTVEEAGRYWLTASISAEAGEKEGVPFKQRASYTATFEVLPL